MTEFLLQWTFSVPLFFIVVFKRHVYKLRYIFPIPYKECTENLKLFIVTWGYHFEHELQWWPLPILISDSRIALGVLGCLQHGIVIPSRTHSSPHPRHTHPHPHTPGISHTFMKSSNEGSGFPTQIPTIFHHVTSSLFWSEEAQLLHAHPEQFLSVMSICWQVLRGCFWRFSSSPFNYKTRKVFIWIGGTERYQVQTTPKVCLPQDRLQEFIILIKR